MAKFGLDFLLKSPVCLPQVVQEGEIAEPRYLDVVQLMQPARPRQAPADRRLVENCFQDAGDIRAVIDQRMPSRTASTFVAELAQRSPGPGLPRIDRPGKSRLPSDGSAQSVGAGTDWVGKNVLQMHAQRLPVGAVCPLGRMRVIAVSGVHGAAICGC